MVASEYLYETSSEIFDRRQCNLDVSECLQCVVLEEKLRIALEEVESIKLIVDLLKSDRDRCPPLYDREANPSGDVSDICEIVHSNESTKWKTLKTKCQKKASPLKTTEAENVPHVAVVNRYELLHNLQDSQDDSRQPGTQEKVKLSETHDDLHLQNLREKDATSGIHGQDKNSTMQVDNQTHPKLLQKDKTQQKGKNVKISYKDCQVHHIPTILNGKIEVKNTGVKNEMNYKNGKNNTQDYKQHKVIMIGDRFIRGIRDNVVMSISDRFSI